MKNETLRKLFDFIRLVFKAVATAMGVAVVVMSIMGKIDVQSAVMLLGIGLAGSGVASLMTKKNED
ncbi:MAG: hypothetical protein IJZ54_06510 [Clostridia bacterium]|nr:hypothetical protein [Clostridia bacterium]